MRTPQSLAGATLLARASPDKDRRARMNARFDRRFPWGAQDQQIVGLHVFTELVRRSFAAVEPDNPVVEQFVVKLVELLGEPNPIPPQGAVDAVRAVLAGSPRTAGLDARQLARLHGGFVAAARLKLPVTQEELAALFVDGERRAAGAGVWLVPLDEPADAVAEAAAESGRGRRSGPWDVGELDDPQAGRVDLGSLLLRVPPGLELRLMDREGDIVAVEIHASRSVLELNAFAAPPGGLWRSLRGELARAVARRGGTSRERAGIGIELWTQTVDHGALPDEDGIRHMRFLGVDGPGWLLRGVLSWYRNPIEAEITVLEEILRNAVVVRGAADLADRARLALAKPR